MSGLGRKLPSEASPGNDRFQYIQDIQVNSLNVAFAA
jgi:hypothetical protein